MKILFEDLRITTEKKSYQTTQNNLEISLGMETENLNLAENSVEIEWKLRKFNDSIFSEGRKNIKIGSFETKLFLNNLLLNSIYVLEIYNPNSVEKTVIYTGNKNNLIIVDENYIFQGNNPKIFGDAVLTNEKKLKLTEDWDVLRRYGNAIISSEQNFFVFAPKIIFTSRKEVPEIIDFFPFDGLLSSKIKLYIIPEITQISPYVFQIDPPTIMRVVFRFKKFKINEIDGFFEEYDYKEEQTIVTNNKISIINLLNFGAYKDFNNYSLYPRYTTNH